MSIMALELTAEVPPRVEGDPGTKWRWLSDSARQLSFTLVTTQLTAGSKATIVCN